MGPHSNKIRWKVLLSQDLPGEQAQQLMAPNFRGSFQETGEATRAAVLALLFPAAEDTRLVFMKRNEYKGPHSAQVSFPGGAWETGDGSLENTAIRETREELGIVEEIEVLGELTPLHIAVSNFRVYPFLGWMNHAPAFHPDPAEVQYVIVASLRQLLDPSSMGSETIYRHQRYIEAPFYRVGKDKIWGATAMMLSELLQLATRLQ